MLTEENRHSWDEDDLDLWDTAMDEYYRDFEGC
jgi:hypothetical protein